MDKHSHNHSLNEYSKHEAPPANQSEDAKNYREYDIREQRLNEQSTTKRLRGRPKKPVSLIPPPRQDKQFPPQPEEYLFALDIGTRSIIGIVGAYTGDKFVVTDFEMMEHPGRAMLDGQVENIAQVGALIKEVKTRLEDRLRFKLERVALAAAGRMLHTVRARSERTIEPRDLADRDVVLGLEGEALETAQATALDNKDQPAGGYYCVGYSIIEYRMDGAPISQLLGHMCSHASVELIAAFLPNGVVEGLYSAVDLCELEVVSLTLEPIAAMNVLIPPELRLLNLALVDIGAGTSDIAVCREGVIHSYEMATIAGDEVTEEILRQYLVDFETAERMKRALDTQENMLITFENILGVESSVERDAIYEVVKPVAKKLAQMIAERIIACNGSSPAAVFLVGGGSQLPGLPAMLAECLEIDADNIAVGARRALKAIDFGAFDKLNGPEFITPMGIALTALTQECFHFFGVTVNGKRLKLLNTQRVRCMEVLFMAGYRTYQIIGQSGRSLMFTLNGQTKVIKGELPQHALLTINSSPGSIEEDIRPGDKITFEPARHGKPASATLRDLLDSMDLALYPSGTVTIDGAGVDIGLRLSVNGEPAGLDYEIKPKDAVEIRSIRTLGDIAMLLNLSGSYYYQNAQLPWDMPLLDGMDIRACASAEPAQPEPEPDPEITISLNDERLSVKAPDGQLLLMHLLEHADVERQQPEGVLKMLVNNEEAGFTSPIKQGDDVKIGWTLPED